MAPKPLKLLRLFLYFAGIALLPILLSCNSETSNSSAKNSETAKKESAPVIPTKLDEEKPKELDWTKMSTVAITCGGSEFDLSVPLLEVANRIESQKLMYKSKPFTDCSGIFHRILDSMNRRCPEHDFPNPNTHRSSRSIGQWYNEKGNFIKITDPENEWDYIKPGAVMFYASKSVDPKTVETEALFQSGGIRHVGVVVDVEKDSNGMVNKYTLFHGRTSGKIAAKTNYHERKPSRSSYPAYGNGSDHWIGVAPIASDKVMDGLQANTHARMVTPPPRTVNTPESQPKKEYLASQASKSNSTKTVNPTATEESRIRGIEKPSSSKKTVVKESKKAAEKAGTNTNTAKTNSSTSSGSRLSDKATVDKKTVSKREENKVEAWAKMEGLSISCEGNSMNLALPLNQVAERLQAQNLMYNVKPFSDCSGIFHRVLDSLDRRCPSHAFPSPKTHRDSRSIGKWYDERDGFVKITNPEEQWAYIKPGAVMFYVSGSVDPKTVSREALFKPGGIRHIGVVVDVEKDSKGVVKKYTLFHGRTTGKPAAKTNYHTRKPSRTSYPAYGNGRDHWIGVAPIASDKYMDEAVSSTTQNNKAETEKAKTTEIETKKSKEEMLANTSSEKNPVAGEKAEGETIDIKAWAAKGGLTIKCEGSKLDLSIPLNEVADRLQSQNLMYNVKPFSDCSGIFHRVLDSLDSRCPSHAFPDPSTHRDSRSIGRWYKEKGTFVKVTDPEKQWEYIKPGAVMFYVSGSVDPKSIAEEALFKPGGIRHIGVVVDVEKDENGIVTRYTLFHGRTSGKPAAKTNYHTRKPSRSTYPIYGNGRDHWIGVAQIASDKVMD
ncbi:MAG: hypothetical protein MRZ79_20870 [Bacteroidia bacterium]|nr:hypothetical protein [Bacteroidia bacterium]